MNALGVLSCRKFLIVVTAGGWTNAASLLEIGRILSLRGHVIEFGTLEGRDHWSAECSFVSKVHILGPGTSAEIEEISYLRMSEWSASLTSSWGPIFETKRFLESSWPAVYRSLSTIVNDPETRPDFIIADYLVDAARDMKVEYDIPLAMHWSQMPTAMMPAPYIPGAAGLQVEILTSEHATIWQRLRAHLVPYTSLPSYLRYRRWVKKMRASAGVHRMLPTLTKPDYLCLVNSFFGLEVAKDIPPNVAAIGPVLPDTLPPLTEPYTAFLTAHVKVLYIALGTHVLLRHDALYRILVGVTDALAAGIIDGIIWSIRGMARKQLNTAAIIPFPTQSEPDHQLSISQLLANQHPNILFTESAPQRALLAHRHSCIYLMHGGPASTNESVFAGIPTITIGVYFDQLQNSMRLRDAGVSIPLLKETFTSLDLIDAIKVILEDKGMMRTNIERLRRIATAASRRKYLAADLIEEVLIDHEGRQSEKQMGARDRGMHLQTADGRMPWWKARNWDLRAIVGGSMCVLLGIPIALFVSLLYTLW